jgi:gamma-glutamylcyclotransferase
MSQLHYAAYGSNLHPTRLRRRIPSATLHGTGVLADHGLHFHKRGRDGSGKASIAPGDSSVFVAVYRIDAAHKPLLDAIEHVGVGYREAIVHVPGVGECFTYMARPSHTEQALRPFCWYHAMVLYGAQVHGFPAPYLARLAAVDRDVDPDSSRRAQNWALLRAMGYSARKPARGRGG